LSGLAQRADAVIIYRNPGRLVTAPPPRQGGPIAALEGNWNSFTGTPIGAHYFVTAGHVGGEAGGTFHLGGVDYTTTAYYDDPGSDLRIYRTDATFSTYATLYRKGTEKGKAFSIFGRGADRGGVLWMNGKRKGFHVNDRTDEDLSWGTNVVTKVAKGVPPVGDMLLFTFDPTNKKPFEAALTEGDAGGGLFIKDGKTWKLAGINYGGDDAFSTASDKADAFGAALWDKGGYYDANGTFIKDVRKNLPGTYSATRISSNLTWIDAVLAGHVEPTALPPVTPGPFVPPGDGGTSVPEPTGTAAVLGGIALLGARRRRTQASGK
jgi:hypothetical protein